MKKFNCLLILMAFSLLLSAQEIPLKISYQGKLFISSVPFHGTKDITFTIGSWSEPHDDVEITEGLYSVILGSVNPIPLSLFDDNSSLELEIEVEGTTLSPNTDILSSPYAFKAENAVDAEKIAGRIVSTTLPDTNQVLQWDGSYWTPETLSSSSCLWSQNGSDIYYNLGPVLIGTTSGGNQKLKIETGSNNQGLRILNNSSNQIALRIDNNAGASRPLFIENASDESVYFGTSGNPTNAVSINNAGTGNALRISNSNGGHGLYVVNSGSGYGGYFSGTSGNVVISGWCDIGGNITKGGGSFKIDHPIEPESKYLYHSFVESPDMMNVYNGNIITDENGIAVIQLPGYFEELNKDFRYQLTCIGVFTQTIIYEKINNNQFTIKTQIPNVEVSWQVTGIRQDPWAEQNRIQVEVEKSDKEKGHYLHYKEYNQPIEKSIEAVKNPDLPEELEKHEN